MKIKDLKNGINSKSNYDYLYILHNLFYDIEKALKDRNSEEIEIISQWIDESIDDYFSYELDQAISNAKKLVLSEKYNYEEFFEPTNWKGYGEQWKPIIDNIIFELGVDTRDNVSENEALQRVLNYTYGDDIQPLEKVKDYEIMAVMALKHIQSALEHSDVKKRKEYSQDNDFDKYDLSGDWLDIAKESAVKSSLYACLAVSDCKSMYDSEEYFKRLQREKKNALKERAKSGGKAKNKRTNDIKKEILRKYDHEFKKYKELGKIISKNDFARKMAIEYEVSETTIRNNWLKGYNPKI